MMNTWSGNSSFGGGPPSQNATSVYDWVKFYPGATSITADTGGTSSASTPLSITIDTAAPSAPTIAASTSAATHVVVLTGTAEANSTVKVFDGTTNLGTTTAGSNGAWSYPTSPLPTGSHSFTATATDAAGNTGAKSSATTVTIAAAPAAPTIASFSTDSGTVGDRITNDSTLTLTGTAEANATVKVFDGATLLGSTVANGGGAWSYTTAALSDATHSLSATASDAAGNAGAASAALAVTIDTTAPKAPSIASFSPDTGTVGDGMTTANALTLTGTAEANATVKVFDGATMLGSTVANGGGAWSYATAALANGGHSLTATATDAAGNTGAGSAALAVTIAAPASPGVPTITSFSTDSGIVGDGITNDKTPTLTGTAPANSTVQVYDGSTLLGTTTANSGGAWTYTTGQLSNGTHQITATATTSTSSGSSAFPDASTTGVPAGTQLTTVSGDFTSSSNGQIIDGLNVNGTIIINNAGVTVRNCHAGLIVIDAPNVTIEDCDVVGHGVGNSGIVICPPGLLGTGSGGSADGATILRCDISGVENGIWLEASGCLIQDNYFHNLAGASTAHIDGIQTPNDFPGMANNIIRHNNFDLNLNTTSSCIQIDNAQNYIIDNNRFYGGSNELYLLSREGGTTRNTQVTNNTFVADQFGGSIDEQPATGLNTFSGNVFTASTTSTSTSTTTTTTTSAPSAALAVTIDAQAPMAPSITSFSPDTGTVGDGVTSANVLTLTGTAEANTTVKVYEGATLLGNATANGSGAWSFTTAALANGAHSLTATATDAAGNTGAMSAALTVTVTTTPPPGVPTITSFSPDTGVVGDGITDPAILTLTGTAVANSTVKVYDGTTLLGTVTANASGTWSFVTVPLPDGLHKFTATDTVSGVTSAASAVMNVTIDTLAPAAPTIASFSTDSGTVGDGITNDNTLTLTGTAETNSTVKVYEGATLLGTATANGSGAWSYTTATLPNGAHSLTATATDAAGNTSANSSALAVTIDTVAPAAPILTGDTVSGTHQVTLTGTAEANSTIKVFEGATQLGTATTNSTGAWTFTTAPLGAGAHDFTATATDVAGNTSALSDLLDPIIGTAIEFEWRNRPDRGGEP